MLRNAGDRPVKVRARYWRVREAGPVALPGASSIAELRPAGGDTASSVSARSEREFDVRFALAADRPVSDLDGTLALIARTGAGSPQRLDVPLKGSAPTMTATAFEPSSVVIEDTRHCPPLVDLICGGDKRVGPASVRVVGARARETLRDLQQAAVGPIQVQLRHDQLPSLKGRLVELKERGDAAVGQLRVDGEASIGAHDGSLVLSRLADGAPTLGVRLHSRYWFPWAVLVIFVGALVAQFLLQTYALKRRRERARRELDEAVRDYNDARGNRQAGTGVPLWHLDDVIAPETTPDPRWRSFDDLDTNRRIAAALRWARNDGDIDEAEAAILGLIVRIRSWLLVHSCLEMLDQLRNFPLPPDRASRAWMETRAALDTFLTLEAVRSEPTDAEAARAMFDRIQHQLDWLIRFAEVWTLYDRLERDPEIDRKLLQAVKLDDLDTQAKPAAERTEAEHHELSYKLDRLRDALLNLLGARPERPELPVQASTAARQMAELRHFERHAGQPQLAFTTAGQVRGRPSAGKGTESKRSRQRPRNYLSGLAHLRFGDLAMTLLIVALASVTYAMTVYDDTWGSLGDYATAFLAGVAGQLVIKWGALPIYRSIRLGAKAPAASA